MKNPTKWVIPEKKRKTQQVKKSISRERDISKSVARLSHPAGWIRDAPQLPSNTQLVDSDEEKQDEVEQHDQDSDTLSEKQADKRSEHVSNSPPPQLPAEITQQDGPEQDGLLEDHKCNDKLEFCTNINTTDIYDFSKKLPTTPTPPLSKRFLR